jgi:DNA modification methylase
MEIKRVPIGQVDNWEKNPRSIRAKDYDRLKKQIQRLGVYKPMIAYKENGRFIVLGGNMRLRALKEIGAKEVDLSVITPKTEAEKIEFALSDNDRAGEYDDQALAELIFQNKDAFETDLYKIDLGRQIPIDQVLDHFGPTQFEATEEDAIPRPQAKTDIKTGDLFKLGDHRLLCGDATDGEAYSRVLEGKPADLVFTDPLYNVGYIGKGARKGRKEAFDLILNDAQAGEKFVQFSETIFGLFRDNLKPGGAFYICSGFSSFPTFVYAIKKNGLIFSTPIIWIKNQATYSYLDYQHKHETIIRGKRGRKAGQPILYGWNKGRHYFRDLTNECDVWEIQKRSGQTMAHPTQKPLALIQRAIRNSTKPGETVLDPFLGSGSTIIAADREGRKAAGIELDPQYIEVSIRRYAAQGKQTEEEIRATRERQAPAKRAALRREPKPREAEAG